MNSTLQTYLVVDLETNGRPYLPQFGIHRLLLVVFDVLRTFDDQLAHQKVKQSLSVTLLTVHYIFTQYHFNAIIASGWRRALQPHESLLWSRAADRLPRSIAPSRRSARP
jgi:hypothetical protein